MIVSCPPFSAGVDFRWLTVREGEGKWRMELLRDRELYLDTPILDEGEIRHFYDHLNREWLTIYPRKMVLRAPYRWNGNTPKRGMRILCWDLWLGTPDFYPGTIAASGWHDALYQFSGLNEMPVKRWQADDVYHQLSEAHSAPLDEVYISALKVFASRAWGKSDMPGLHARIEREPVFNPGSTRQLTR